VSPRRLSSVALLSAGLLSAGFLSVGRAAADEPTRQPTKAPTKEECVVANETAQDLQHSGKLVEARAQLVTCAASACPAAVRLDCADRLQAVGRALPTVVFVPKDAGAGEIAGASLVIDGVALDGALDGTPVPVNPGQHTFAIGVTGVTPIVLRLVLREGERVRREIIFRAVPHVATTARSGAEGGVQVAPVSPPPSPGSSALTTRRIGWAAIGAGAAGVTLGSVFGLLAVGRKSSLRSACNGSLCPPTQEDNIEALHVNAVAANVSFLIGFLGLGAGGVLLFAFPEGSGGESPHAESALVVRPWAGLGSVGAAGRFR
jgi:hypothetical protein